jgi:hypothetical protein
MLCIHAKRDDENGPLKTINIYCMMQKRFLILLLVLAGSMTTKAQSLKDLLYGGKLRMDSNTVLRKTDDLKSRIDTGQRKPVVQEKTDMAAVPADSARTVAQQVDAAANTGVTKATAAVTDTAAASTNPVSVDTAVATAAVPTKSNNRIWKEYTDSLVNTLKADVLSSKKIKKETYSITVGYEVEATGQVNITNVNATPANALLEAQVKQLIETTPPQLSPTLDSNGKPRKIKRNYNFTVTKD